MDYVVKLLAICERLPTPDGGEAVRVRVHPAMIPRSHPLASVRGANNAVFVEAEAAGELMFYGAGAGGDPTASAVLGDVVAVARHRVAGGRGPGESRLRRPARRSPWAQAVTRYHISLDVADRPGVLAQVADGLRRRTTSRSRRCASRSRRGRAAGATPRRRHPHARPTPPSPPPSTRSPSSTSSTTSRP